MTKYSKIETLNLSKRINKEQCLVDLDNLIINEGFSGAVPIFIQNEIVLDMDCVEKIVADEERRNRNKSMDCVLVIIDSINSTKETLMVEFRFNYINMRNLDRNALYGKVSGTKINLINELNTFNEYLFIFNSNMKQQAINRFRRMIPNLPINYVVLDIDDLKSRYF